MSVMRKSIHAPEKIQTTTRFEKITLKDAFFVMMSIGFGYMTKFWVLDWLGYFYVAAFPVVSYLLLLPSLDSPQKKNYQTIITVLMKDRRVYKAVEKSNTEPKKGVDSDGI